MKENIFYVFDMTRLSILGLLKVTAHNEIRKLCQNVIQSAAFFIDRVALHKTNVS